MYSYDRRASNAIRLNPGDASRHRNYTASQSGHTLLMTLLGGEGDVVDIYEKLDEDEQSKDLFGEVIRKLSKELELDSGSEEALSRVRGLVSRGKSWDISLIRNNVFKAANSLGIKLPSSMF